MSAASHKKAFDLFIQVLEPCEGQPDDQIMTIRLRSDVARAWLEHVRLVRDLDGASVLKATMEFDNKRARGFARSTLDALSKAQSDLRIAKDIRRRADDALWSDFRVWYWALIFSWLTHEVVQELLS